MSAQVCILIIVVIALMAILFRKIVRTDARDDFKIKNILKYGDMENELTEENINSNIQEPTSFSQKNEYRTEVHNESTYYEKKGNYDQPQIDREAISNEQKEKFEQLKNNKNIKVKKDVLQMIKSFYRGITFTIGFIVCLYSLFGIAKFVQTTDDAIIYSIWLLIGVILIK